MRIVSHRKLKEFYETNGREDSRAALGRWYEIAKEQYEFALMRIEELLPLIDDNSTPKNDRKAIELSVMSDIVVCYEDEHYPVEKPSISELIELYLEEKGLTQKQLAHEIGVSPSRVNDYISGRSEPTLKNAGLLCKVLNIPPSVMLRV
jgi:HTH-type transcriptional regulator/antitoxin HigA